jgi:hypothetical protein
MKINLMHVNNNLNLNHFKNNLKLTIGLIAKSVALSSTLALAIVGGGVSPVGAVGVQSCKVTGEFDNPFFPNLLSSFSIPSGPSQPITTDYQFKYLIPGTENCESFTNTGNQFFTNLTQFNILGVEFSGGSTLVSKVDDVSFTPNGSDLEATVADINLLSPWNLNGVDYDTLDIELALGIDPIDSSLQNVSFDLDFSSSMTNNLLPLDVFDNAPNSPTSVTSTPEPASIIGLLGLGALALSNSMKKKKVI